MRRSPRSGGWWPPPTSSPTCTCAVPDRCWRLPGGRRLTAGWPDDHVHFEYFKNTTEIDDSSTFEVALARSALTVTVPAGSTILEVLRESGVPLPSSCEQGACGTCVATVLEGEPDHQDVYLNDSDHEAGDRIMTCVSRARSDRLVLDL